MRTLFGNYWPWVIISVVLATGFAALMQVFLKNSYFDGTGYETFATHAFGFLNDWALILAAATGVLVVAISLLRILRTIDLRTEVHGTRALKRAVNTAREANEVNEEVDAAGEEQMWVGDGNSTGSAPETGDDGMEGGIGEIRTMLVEGERTATYRFHTSVFFTFMAVGVGLAILPTDVALGVIPVNILGGSLGLLSFVGWYWSGVEYRPERYRRAGVTAGGWIMTVGVASILAVSIVDKSAPQLLGTAHPLLKVAGLLLYLGGLYSLVFSTRRREKNG